MIIVLAVGKYVNGKIVFTKTIKGLDIHESA